MCLLLLVVTLLARLALLALLLPVGCGVLGCPVQVVAGPLDLLGLRRSLPRLFSYAPLSVFGLTRCSLPMGVSVGVGRVHGDRRGAMSENS